MFRVLGFRDWGFGVLGFGVWGFGGLGSRVSGLKKYSCKFLNRSYNSSNG